MADEITNFDDVIDSRDVVARIEELEAEREALADAANEAEDALEDYDATEDAEGEREPLASAWEAAEEALREWDKSEAAGELTTLRHLADQAEGCADWRYGETLIRDSYFKTYAMQLAEDVGAINGTEQWPLDCIDWDKAARQLQMDYTAVEFDGITYWIRS